jgi:hypothetical protein
MREPPSLGPRNSAKQQIEKAQSGKLTGDGS